MRILVHELVSGGGFPGGAVPASLAREGAAMRDALVADLAVLGRHRIVTTAAPGFPLRWRPGGVDVVAMPAGNGALLDGLLASVDAAWLVAPETGGALEDLATRAETLGTRLLGSSATAIRQVSDKARLPALLAGRGITHPETRVVSSLGEARRAAAAIGFPVVLKPARGAGCDGVSVARGARELSPAIGAARRAAAGGAFLVQRYVTGVAASVSLLSDGRRAEPLSVNAQSLRTSGVFVYRGGVTPLDHPLAKRAAAVARIVCEMFSGLKGYVGVDLVLTASEAVVIEVNPRLTSAYLGVRRAMDENLASLALAACAGRLPKAPRLRRQLRYTAAGRILATGSLLSRSEGR